MAKGVHRVSSCRGFSRAVAAVAALFVILAPAATAAPGQLDRSFGLRGIGGGELGPHYGGTWFETVSEEADGSLLAVRDGTLRRYLPSGALDVAFPPRRPPARQLATLADGKVLLPGDDGRIRRLNADGTPDTGFNGGESEPAPSEISIQAIEILASGKILVAGSNLFRGGPKTSVTQVALSRLNPDGTVDRSFGAEGSVRLRSDYGLAYSDLVGIVVDEAGDGVLVVGRESLVKLSPDGKLDRSYGSEGVTTLGKAQPIGFKALPHDRVLLAGTMAQCCGRSRFFVAEFGPDGRLDPAFATGRGIATIGSGGLVSANAVLWEADGSILIGGSSTSASIACRKEDQCPSVPALARFAANGDPDQGFGTGGLFAIDALAAPYSAISSVRIIIARRSGGTIVAGNGGFDSSIAFLAAFGSSGALDPSFGSGGIVRERRPEPSRQVSGPVAVAPDGKILVAGHTDTGAAEGLSVIRYTPRGTIDRRFGRGAGFVRAPGTTNAVALAVDGAGGAVVLSSGGELVRFTPAGVIDPRFDKGRLRSLAPSLARFRAIDVQPDGKILVAGTSRWLGPRSRMLVVRLLPSGRLDPAFGHGGLAFTGCRHRGRCSVNRIAVQPDGRILLAGRVRSQGRTHQFYAEPSRLALARLLPSGAVDRNFGQDGLATMRIGKHAEASALGLAAGKILVAGWANRGQGPECLLMRYRPDGSLDRSFAKAGVAFERRGGIPTTVLPTAGRIVVISEDSRRVVLAHRRNGHLDRSYARPRRPLVAPGWAEPSGALQDGKVIVAWSAEKRSLGVIKLARLTNR